MSRHAVLKIRFLVGIILACVILIGSFVYYIHKQNTYLTNQLTYARTFTEKSNLVDDFKVELLYVHRIKSQAQNDENNSQSIRQHLSQAKDYLDKIATPNVLYGYDFEGVSHLQDLLTRTIRTDIAQENAVVQTLEGQEIENTCDNFITGVSHIHDQKYQKEEKLYRETNHVLALIGILTILTILYILYRTTKIVERIRSFAKNEKKINADFARVSKQMEDNNWILQGTNEMYESILGIDDIGTVCSNALTVMMKALDPKAYAGAIYIRENGSNRFALCTRYGLAQKDTIPEFEEGDGFLGQVVQDIAYKIHHTDRDRIIKLNTTFIDHVASSIILVPIHHEKDVVGLLELAVDLEEDDQQKVIDYLTRATMTIASHVKFGQNNTIMRELLERTQKQTEELEVQQEELRITNEELIYKTNLLESSEEELRVQQEELSQANKELNEKAEELHVKNIDLIQTQALVEQKISEIQQSSKYKTEFMANMSHELRTPLNSILILAKLLQDNKHHNLTEDQVKYASVIHGAGTDLLELINQLLDLSKIESGKVDINEESITSALLVENLENLFKEIAKQKNIQFSIDTQYFPSYFVSDEHRLEQILKNFLSNAFKFTDHNGKIDTRFYLKDDYLHFEVTDSGKGIAKDKQEVIFEAFRQEDGSTNRKYGGTGLGLTISREIAMLLDGYITLESTLGEGSTFTLIIPFHTETKRTNNESTHVRQSPQLPPLAPINSPPHPTGSEGDTTTSQTILIIEDDFNFANIVKDFAENHGFQALLAHDGAQGINLAKQNLPDAIILDVMLPVSDGWEVLRTLKENESTKHIPVHMMSGADYSAKEILEKGAIGFLPKPVSEEKIQEVFSNILLNIDKEVKKILLIEDQEVLSNYIKNTFAERNINVIQAFTVESASNRLNQEENIDCIILDISLPDGSGLKLLEEIKNTAHLKHIPVIINTAEELTAEQTKEIMRYTKSMVMKNGTSTNRLIDEVNLFLNKITDEDYSPVHNIEKLQHSSYQNNNPLKGKKVLIVDDDMRNIFALTTSLENQDMDIAIANNGREALDMVNAADNKFDIVLMDIMMPEMDGHEAIKAIRSEKRHAKLPIIAVTAKAMKGDREKSIQIGANDYVSKPIDINRLISLMQVWLS